uniref:Sodium-dependent glucose transporter 1-like n=1 Tax=Saccoglossus kowalevskii TaxID=10224 RepID=A0ABM0GL10_SACKO
GNVVCVNLWGKESGPWMQALHFFFAFGSTVAPLIAAPFLTASSEAGMLLNGTVTPAPTTIPTTSLVLIASNTSEVVYVQQSTGVMYGSNHQSKRDTDMAKFSMLLDEMIERIERSITDDIPHGKPSMLTTTNSTGGSVVYLKQSTEFPEEAMSEEHAEDGEIQFTDVYDGWNDTHAGNEDDIAINRSTLIVPYTIVAIFNLLASLPFFFFYCIGSQPCLLKKEANNEATADHVENENETIVFRVTLLFLLFLFTFVYVGHESAYGGFVYTFAMKSDLDFNAQFASYLNSAFWGSFALSRAMAIGVAMFMTPRAMLIADLCGLCVASSLLAAFGDQNMYILWGASILLGISMGSVFPSGLAWAERYIELTGKATSVFVIGAASSEMAFPWLLGYLIKTFSVSTLMYVILSLSLSTTIVYIIMQIIASKK